MIRLIYTWGTKLLALLALAGAPAAASAQPAQGLTEFRVVAAASPLSQANLGRYWDSPIAPGAISTPSDHGGAWLRVAVFERGYGTGQVATFNGARMQLEYSDPQIGANRQVYGYVRYYYIAGPFTGGRFTNSATSIAAPWGTKSTAINIR